MTSSSSKTQLRPLWQPFVLRPVFWAGLPCLLVLAACFFFWEPIYGSMGQTTWYFAGAVLLVPIIVFGERVIRYGKTAYEIRPDRIVVRTGTLFSERVVELDLRNITLVEWDSPFFLRKFYGVGHVTAQEAGSGSKPARMTYLEDPAGVYDRIDELMSARGFSMRRDRLVQEETPGHLGAAVDWTALQVRLFWVVGLIVAQSLPDSLMLLIGDGASLLQLLVGNYEVFSDLLSRPAFSRARIGVVVLGLVCTPIVFGWLTTLYVDLLHRKYTLYDDVIDYEDGFLNETRKFIPLENLADTRVQRPFYKRPLGLSDVTLSSQGAENAISFRSTPNGPSFAEAIRELVDRSELEPEGRAAWDEGRPGPREAEARAQPTASPDRAVRDARLDSGTQPDQLRAVLRGASGAVGMVVLWGVAVTVPAVVGATDSSFEIGPFAVAGLFGALAAGVVIAGVAGAAGAGWWVLKAWSTEFRLDREGAHYSFDLFSRDDKRFALERVTSVMVRRNPLDWIAGTATLRFRSIGSDEDIDFWGVDYADAIVDEVRARLGLPDRAERPDSLDPDYDFVDGVAAEGPLYAAVGGPLALMLAMLATFGLVSPLLGAGLVTAALAAVIAHQTYRAVLHERIGGQLTDRGAEVSGGIVRLYRHLAPIEHVKAVGSRRYPASDAGQLTLQTAGFPVSVGHLPDIADLHERVDARLGLANLPARGASGRDGVLAALKPSAATEAIRWSPLLIVGVGFAVVPAVWFYYRLVDYTVEEGRLVADTGIYFDRRTTVLFDRVDHIETDRGFAHQFFGTANLEVYTVGSSERDLVFRSIPRDADALDVVRRRLDFADG